MEQTECRVEQAAQALWKDHTEFWWFNLLYKSIPVTAGIKTWGMRPLAFWYLSSHRLGARIFVFCENYALRYRYLFWADHSSRWILQTVVCPLSVIPVMGNHCQESSRGATEKGVLVRRPRDFKEKETGTDSYGVWALKLLGWHWFGVAFKSEL